MDEVTTAVDELDVVESGNSAESEGSAAQRLSVGQTDQVGLGERPHKGGGSGGGVGHVGDGGRGVNNGLGNGADHGRSGGMGDGVGGGGDSADNGGSGSNLLSAGGHGHGGGVDGNGRGPVLAVVGDLCLEAVDLVGGVLDNADTAVGIQDRVGAGDQITVAGLLAGLGVAGDGIAHAVPKVVGGVGGNLFLLNNGSADDGGGLGHGVGDRVHHGLSGHSADDGRLGNSVSHGVHNRLCGHRAHNRRLGEGVDELLAVHGAKHGGGGAGVVDDRLEGVGHLGQELGSGGGVGQAESEGKGGELEGRKRSLGFGKPDGGWLATLKKYMIGEWRAFKLLLRGAD